MLDIRLRLANDDGTPGRVLDTMEIAWTGYSAQSVKFAVSEKASEKLDAPFLVIVEYTTSATGRWKRVPRNDLFIVDEDSGDSVDTDGVVKFTGSSMVPWLAARYPLWWRDGDSVDDLERRYTDRTPGFVLRDLIQVAQAASGWGSRIALGFTDSTDSAGQPWSQRVSMAWPLFTTPLSRVMQTLAEQGYMEWWSEGYQLRAANPGAGTDRSDTVTLGGPGFSRAPASRKFDPATAIVVQYELGWTHFHNDGAEGRFGNLFKVMTQPGAKTRDVAEKNVQPALAESRAMQEELSYEWELSGDGVPVPWESFQVGDVVTARTRRGKKVLRVIGLDVSKDSKGLVKATAVVGSKLLSLQAKLAKRSAAASVGQIIGGSGVALPPAAAPAKTAPLPPAAVRVASNVGSWGEDGSERSTVTIAWDAVAQAVDGLAVDIDTYEVWSRPVNEPMSLLTRTTALSTTVATWTPGQNRLIAVRARSRAGVWSQLSPEVGVTPARPVSIVPKVPTGLAAASNSGAFASDGTATATVRLTWDAVTQATDGGLVQVAAYEVLIQDGQAWTPLLETTAREVTITVPTGKARGFRVRARTALGVWGDPSATTTVTGAAPSQVTTATSAPSLTTGLGLVLIGWDGKLSTGAAVPSSFQLLYAETAPASTGPWTRVGVPARAAGQVATVRGTVGATVFARLVWVDTLGRTSVASAAASTKVASVAPGDLDSAVSDAISKAQQDATKAVGDALTAQETANTAKADAATAKGVADGAVQNAADAAKAAADAAGIAGAKPEILIQATAPAVALQKSNTLWIDTTGGANTPKRWNGTAWVAVTDKTAVDAASAAATAKTAADDAARVAAGAQSAATSAATAAQTAQTKADDAARAASAAQGTADSAATAAATAQGQADAANTAAAKAATVAADAGVRADAAAAADGLVTNPLFANWPAGSSYPKGLAAWSGGGGVKETALSRPGRNGLRFNVPDATAQMGASFGAEFLPSAPYLEYWTVTVDLYIVSGSLGGAGVILDWTSGPRQLINFLTELPSAMTGRWYTVTKTLRRPAPAAGWTYSQMSGYLMAQWSGHTGAAAKSIVYDRLIIRPATSEEIRAITAEADAAKAQARADAAHTAAGTAQSRADAAFTSASGRNAMYHATTTATGTGTRAGDIWHQWTSLAADGKLLATWRWSGSAWVKTQLDETYIPLLNIGEGTYGKLTGGRLDAQSVWADEAWLNSMRAGVVETSMVSAGFAQNLDLTANGAITLMAGQVSDQAAELSAQRSELDGVTDQVSSLGGQVGEVRSSASAAAVAAAAAQAAAREAQDKADGLAAYVRITGEGLEVGAPGAATAVKITPSSMTFNVNGVPGAYLDAGQFIAPRFVGEEVDLANVKIQKQGTRTVVKAI